MFGSRSTRCVPYKIPKVKSQSTFIPFNKELVDVQSAIIPIPVESEKEVCHEEASSLPEPQKNNNGCTEEEASCPSPPPKVEQDVGLNSVVAGPEITEVSTAANIRLLHKVSELQDMVAMWVEFRELRTDGEGSDYLARCYIGEILSSWQNVKKGYNDVVWLRENGNGTAIPTQLEHAVSTLLGKVGEWRNKNMPRRNPCHNRRSLPNHWAPGSQGSYGRRSNCMHRCYPAAPMYGPCQKDCGCGLCSGRVSPACSASPPTESGPEAVDRRKSRALGLADIIATASQDFSPTREQLFAEIGNMRKNLLRSQEEWMARRSNSHQYCI